MNLPCGEVFISPKDANGIYVVDGSIGGVGVFDSPIEITVKDPT